MTKPLIEVRVHIILPVGTCTSEEDSWLILLMLGAGRGLLGLYTEQGGKEGAVLELLPGSASQSLPNISHSTFLPLSPSPVAGR